MEESQHFYGVVSIKMDVFMVAYVQQVVSAALMER